MEEGRDQEQRAADRSAEVGGQGGAWPGPEPSPFSQQSMTHGRGAHPCTARDSTASPSLAGTAISIYFAITHTPKSGLALRQEKRDLGLQGARPLE